MAYSEQVIMRAKARLEEDRRERERENERRRVLAYEKYPRLPEIERQLRLTMTKLIANTLRSSQDQQEIIAAIRRENLALQERKAMILAGESDLDYETPICMTCEGTGYIGSTMCDCLRELCRQEQKRELTSLLGNGRESFDSFQLEYYPDTLDPDLGVSPRRLMSSNLKICRRYGESFGPYSGNLFFTGATGLGKTFLSACIARQVADKCHSVVYETVIRIFKDFETEKFGQLQEQAVDLTRKYMDCDLLIMDDLGTEMTTQFTVSALYQIINGRLMNHRPTIISTNLMPDMLEQRYNAQIASRITGTYRIVRFAGNDIRRMKKGVK